LVLVSWIKSYLYYVMTAGLILTIAHCQRALFAIGWGSVSIGIASLFFSSVSSERLQFEVGTLGNPNYVALFLLLGVPAALLFTWNAKGVFGRVLGWIAVVVLVSVALHTGSRMVVLVLLAALAMLFFRASPSRKLLLLGAALVFGLLAVVITPQRILVRYATLFTNMPAAYANEEFSQEVDSAVSSTISRRVLLERSLETTLHHPLLGVGPGMFSVYTGTDEDDPRGAWKETHNTYTQLSSEVGLPGFLFYLVALWYCLRTSFSTYRRLRREPDQTRTANTAYAVFLTLFLFAVAAPFASLAYDFFFPVFAGLAIGLEHTTRQFQSAPSAPRAQAGLGVSTPLPRARRER
jgi:O-antigen ligase